MDVYSLIPIELMGLIPFIYVLGIFIRKINRIPNNYIPSIIFVLSIMFTFLQIYDAEVLLTETIVSSMINGSYIAFACVFGNQQLKQIKGLMQEKGDEIEDEEDNQKAYKI